jgi:hypothetical protein
MSGCTRLSDRIPDVALGRTSWTADEAAHLRACAECRAELALVQATVAIGRKAPVPADLGETARAVEGRLAREPRRRASRWPLGRPLVGAAAAAALVATVWTRWPTRAERSTPLPPASSSQALVPLPELELLEPAELDSLWERMEAPIAGSSTLDAPSLGDLEDTELEQVLATWEG